jgi:hypothetical protein
MKASRIVISGALRKAFVLSMLAPAAPAQTLTFVRPFSNPLPVADNRYHS